ncbi:hypothetical protein CEXT_707391 [Caerostris extrusa]|uniref:Uncharacterized protein n=1 Tax=Caerostris extrusa TaxID=172846 RepID=A0AAV4XQK7_CAEEX|nr:hypothetical protein CEXT_707391 [Caerostris extrusa]
MDYEATIEKIKENQANSNPKKRYAEPTVKSSKCALIKMIRSKDQIKDILFNYILPPGNSNINTNWTLFTNLLIEKHAHPLPIINFANSLDLEIRNFTDGPFGCS